MSRLLFVVFMLLGGHALAEPLLLNVEQVRKSVGPVSVTVIELHETTDHKVVMADYTGVPLRNFLAISFPDQWPDVESDLYLYALDGYLRIVAAKKVLAYDAYLTYQRTDGGPFVVDNVHQNEKDVPLDPFYLVWDNLKHDELAGGSSSDWPYQINRVELLPHSVLMQQLPAGATPAVRAGFEAYVSHCISCHSIDGFGGKKVLTDMKALVQGMSRATLSGWIDNPCAMNKFSNMPALHVSYQGEERLRVINRIIDYLEVVTGGSRPVAVSTPESATVPTFEAQHETTPIPAGVDDTDDPAIWLHPDVPERSLVLGVSKNKPASGGQAGIGIYSLSGELVKYINHDRLNNVDLRYNVALGSNTMDLAVASNRDKKALSLFAVTDNDIRHVQDISLRAEDNREITEEPYGLCLGQNTHNGRLYAFSPMKSGLVYQHAIDSRSGRFWLRHVRTLDTARFISRSLDQHLIDVTVSEVVWEGRPGNKELIAEISEELRDRFQLEGCVVDDVNDTLYYGMENLGVFKFDLNARENDLPVLIARVEKAKSEPGAGSIKAGVPRIINDVEGLALLHGPEGRGALIVSVQGLDEYALFDRKTDQYIGSFKLDYGGSDPVTETDGLDIISTPLGPTYPDGLLVVHDHLNTDSNGQLLNANYKLTGLTEIRAYFPVLKFAGFYYDPRSLPAR